jgi:hypothetical protein
MHPEELRGRLEQLENEVLMLKHVLRFILAAHHRHLPSFSGQRVDPELVRQVRREIQARWHEEWEDLIPPKPRLL